MPKDGLKRLPDHIVAPLLRALMCVERRPDSQLRLQRIDYGRPPGWDAKTDFNVLFRGQRIGRIWRFDYSRDVRGDMGRYPWHWHWRNVVGRADRTGHAPTLESALADFRQAWDAAEPDVTTSR